MRVLVPVREKSGEESIVCNVGDAGSFALLELGEGMEIVQIDFRDDFSDELFDYIVTSDKNDDIDEAFELGARALLARPGMSIEEIVEAMMFRELDEIA